MKTIIFALVFSGTAFAQNFYADANLQKKHPNAFAVSKESIHFHKESIKNTDKLKLTAEITKDSKLTADIENFNHLTLDDQIHLLKQIFALEVKIMNIKAPNLVIDETSIKGYAYFEFDPAIPGPGTVYLNKKKLKEEANPSQFINLLLHETRHSYQFQLAQKSSNPEAKGFMSAFKTQKEFFTKGTKTSFYDFMLLLNEYEAFQFSNFITGSLSGFREGISDMGTLASQYDENGKLYIDPIKLIQENNFPLDVFNELSKKQFMVIYGSLMESK